MGIKLTGEEAYGALINLRADLVATAVSPLTSTDPGDVVAVIAKMVASFGQGHAITAVGITVGGLVDHNSVVRHCAFLDWHGVDLGALAFEATKIPTHVENDLIGLTETEHWFGAGRGIDNFALLTIGAGVGYGLVEHDRLVNRPDLGAGTVGHIPLDPTGPRCELGHIGCAVAMLSQGSISASVSIAKQRPVSYEECLELASCGDPAALHIVTASARALGRLVAQISCLAIVKRVIVSGEGVRLALIGAEAMAEGIAEVVNPWSDDIDLVISELDFRQWAKGAAVVGLQAYVLGEEPPQPR